MLARTTSRSRRDLFSLPNRECRPINRASAAADARANIDWKQSCYTGYQHDETNESRGGFSAPRFHPIFCATSAAPRPDPIDLAGSSCCSPHNIARVRGDLFQSPMRSHLRLTRSAVREVREYCDLVMDQYLRYARERVTTAAYTRNPRGLTHRRSSMKYLRAQSPSHSSRCSRDSGIYLARFRRSLGRTFSESFTIINSACAVKSIREFTKRSALAELLKIAGGFRRKIRAQAHAFRLKGEPSKNQQIRIDLAFTPGDR